MGHDMEKSTFKLDASKTADLERRYGQSEVAARQESELHDARKEIENADNAGAKSKTPSLFQEAKAKMASAEQAIALSPRSSKGYSDAVTTAKQAAKKLEEVLAIARQNKASEKVAFDLWTKNQQLNASQLALSQQKNDAQNSLQQANSKATAEKEQLESQIDAKDAALQTEGSAIATLQTQNNRYVSEEQLKQHIEEIKKTFSPEEADVMKDGKNIVVRLKQMQFSSGRAELNPNSFATLKKVDTLIAAVPAEQITVEGHTDSIGSNAVNKALSEKRAEAVKKYLMSQNFPEKLSVEAVGYGSDKPIATNKTKDGRATNRRVDVVIQTPVVL
jgi:outer membrane protein OmpA-like peptidoglycan-associated protein